MEPQMVDNLTQMASAMMTSSAVIFGWIVTACLVFHMVASTKEEFKPRSVMYLFCVGIMLWMHHYPPAKTLSEVIF